MVDIACQSGIARMAELADAPDSKSGSFTRVGVRPSLRAPDFWTFRENRKNQGENLSGISSMLVANSRTKMDLTGAAVLTIVGPLNEEIKSYI